MKHALFRKGTWLAVATALILAGTPATAAEESIARAGFEFREVSPNSLGVWEEGRPVLVYNHGVMSKEGVPPDRNRSSYIHPLYGLDGEILTDDFPEDHYHHRGVFWAWPQVGIGNQQHDLWMLKGIEHRFERWIGKETTGKKAVLTFENGWYVNDEKVMAERVRIEVHGRRENDQAIDIELRFTPLQRVTLRGAEGKSYGGLTLRFAPHAGTVITTPLGQKKEDLHITRMPWADLSGVFEGRPAGAAILIRNDHPDYPPEWLTRHYGVLCVGWPGVTAQTLSPGKTIECRYRIWVHRSKPSVAEVAKAYESYLLEPRNE